MRSSIATRRLFGALLLALGASVMLAITAPSAEAQLKKTWTPAGSCNENCTGPSCPC